MMRPSVAPPTAPAPRIVSFTVGAYALGLFLCPPALRAAYGAPMVQVFRQCCRDAHARGGAWGVARLWLPTLGDLLAGASAEHGALLASWWREGSPAQRARRSTIVVFWAYCAFVVAGFGFQKLPEYEGVAAVTRARPVLGLAFAVTAACSAFALVAVVAGGLPLALAALRAARVARRRDIPLLFAVPPLALAAFLGVTAMLERTSPGGPDRLVNGVWIGALVTAIGASAAAISTAIARGQIDARLLAHARVPAALVALAMVGMLASTVVWGLVLRAAAPRLFAGMAATGAYGVFTWTRIVVVMALATLVAVAGVGRGVAPRRGERIRANDGAAQRGTRAAGSRRPSHSHLSLTTRPASRAPSSRGMLVLPGPARKVHA
jgi:hypothetical protein